MKQIQILKEHLEQDLEVIIIEQVKLLVVLSGGSSGSAFGTDLGGAAGLGDATDSLANFPITGPTSGIGILRRTGSGVLKAEITALESMGMGKTISNPKVFTLDNQVSNSYTR